MLGGARTEQYEFFAGSLRDLIPDEHGLARVARVLDLSWLRGEVADLYCPDSGRPGIAPEAAVRLMLAGFLMGIVHDGSVRLISGGRLLPPCPSSFRA